MKIISTLATMKLVIGLLLVCSIGFSKGLEANTTIAKNETSISVPVTDVHQLTTFENDVFVVAVATIDSFVMKNDSVCFLNPVGVVSKPIKHALVHAPPSIGNMGYFTTYLLDRAEHSKKSKPIIIYSKSNRIRELNPKRLYLSRHWLC